MSNLAVSLGLADLTVAQRIERVEAFLAQPASTLRRAASPGAIEALRISLQRAKRKNLFALPARMPAFKSTAVTSVPTMETLARYCGSTSEAFRIREAIKARGIPAKAEAFVPAAPVTLVA